MRIGRLRHPLIIQTRTKSKDSFAESLNTWTDSISCRGEVQPLTGREGERVKTIRSEATHAVTIRAKVADITTHGHRIKFGARVLGILEANNVFERDRQWELICKEIKA
jgi:SPP1 family predicted phage head-tail adaptor